ncbi:DUF3320 domain-containing protein [Adhaeribacter aquaticus]|uniref:DUF3320 domain-containing protein n=1 Tax=Adhaeribacter aquaticus TaxID=299567 RepID=UPI0004035311|nr:DUF3320 domain-containing protein [Adhaeribacter aquaticus]
MPVSDNLIAAKLEAARRELLDLSLRNPLLNYRPLKSRGIEVVNEIPAEIFRILVKEGKPMSFLPIDSKTALDLIEQAEGKEDNFVLTPAQTDNKLQTKETIVKLQARLLDTYHSARLYVEEQGVSILYLVLGTLTWYEGDNREEGRQAPLILVPVELQRTTAREQFQVRYTGGEIESNLSLIARLKADFGIAIPELPEPEEIDVVQYFDEVWRQVVGRKGWIINSRSVALGFFSFGRFMMYNDLHEATWPVTAKPVDHKILKALLTDEGFQEPHSAIPDEAHLDDFVVPAENWQVVDADSTQTLAILDVNQGRNLVIQGPPGTGKSQTITNLIAEAIGRGKTVLFVAEKMAALEVVKRRLDKTGLGDACLELHSHKTNKKDLLQELKRTLDLGKPQVKDLESEMNLLTQLRSRLNAYAEAVNTPVAQSDLTVYAVYGLLLKQREQYAQIQLPRLALPSLLAWSRDDFKRREALIEEVQARLKQIGQPNKLLFWGSQRRTLLPPDIDKITGVIKDARQKAEAFAEAAINLAGIMHFPAPVNKTGAEELILIVRRLLQSPNYKGVEIKSGLWQEKQKELGQLITAGKTIKQIQQQYADQLIPEAWEQDVQEIRQNLITYGDKWWRFLAGPYRKSKNKLAGFTRLGLPKENTAQLRLVDAILEAQRQVKVINQYAGLGQSLFKLQWQGKESDWEKLNIISDWLKKLQEDIIAEQLPVATLDYLALEPDLRSLQLPLATAETAFWNFEKAVAEVTQVLFWADKVRFSSENRLANLAFTDLLFLLNQWQAKPEELHQVVAWNSSAERLQHEGLQEIINLSLDWPEASQNLVAAFQQTWLEALLERAYEERPALLQFERAGHEEVIQKFKHLDYLSFTYNQARLAALHWHQLPQHRASGQLGVLRREFEKKVRHLPVRQLMAKAGKAIQAIKPVFMMGPLSIANFLPPEAVDFDLVIFDEASQVKPVDAFGAILRARQVVVVGDSKQMPPTSFFDALVKDEVVEEENIAAEVESVLGLFAAQGAPQRMLRWHYRSRHESLITVSNQEFYDNKLVVFPSPDTERKETGLVYNYLPDTFYDRGKSRTNPQEAEVVARAIMAHAKNKPELTLGVAAFSMAQMQAIIYQLELLRRQDINAETFFNAHPNEPFFVKNLENVQGDERDVIFISIGYGRTEEGHLSMSFGPLNGVGGERRLNVLITRARLRCEVFTNLLPEDIDLTRTQSRGVQAFKTFLSYAKNGGGTHRRGAVAAVTLPLEEEIRQFLTNAGYTVDAQVGSAAFCIDLAIAHPQQPGKYLAGITCDGANYHRARSARDRDRLQQLVLEGLKWNIYRIWSTDWFRNPEAEQNRLLEYLEKALQGELEVRTKDKQVSPPEVPVISRQTISAPLIQNDIPLYKTAALQIKIGDKQLTDIPVNIIQNWVEEVVEAESPVHVQEVISRIAEATHVNRIGPRVRTAIESAIALSLQAGEIKKEKEFLWLSNKQEAPLRSRKEAPASLRTIESIAPEELSLAIQKIIRDGFGIEPADIAPAVVKLLGLTRVNEDLREVVTIIIEELQRQGVVKMQEGMVRITGS